MKRRNLRDAVEEKISKPKREARANRPSAARMMVAVSPQTHAELLKISRSTDATMGEIIGLLLEECK